MNAPLCESPLSSRPPDFEARLSTVQLVVATETKRLSPDAVTAAVQWSVSSTVIDVSGSREGARRNARLRSHNNRRNGGFLTWLATS